MLFVTAVHPISGGSAPGMPPTSTASSLFVFIGV